MNGFTLMLSMIRDKFYGVPLGFRLLVLFMLGVMVGLML